MIAKVLHRKHMIADIIVRYLIEDPTNPRMARFIKLWKALDNAFIRELDK